MNQVKPYILQERCPCWDGKTSPKVIYNEGGRAATGYRGTAGDCVVRAIAIAADIPYNQVYESLKNRNAHIIKTGRGKVAEKLRNKGATPRNGNYKRSYHEYILSLGFTWIPCMKIGSGATVHLCEEELPMDKTIILRLSRHLSAMINGVIHDTFNPDRCTIVVENHNRRIMRRCVYGYYIAPERKAA